MILSKISKHMVLQNISRKKNKQPLEEFFFYAQICMASLPSRYGQIYSEILQ